MAKRSIFELCGGVTRFGHFTVLGEGDPIRGNSHPNRCARCRCDCGQIRNVQPAKLKSGAHLSCGCLSAERARKRFTKHGQHRSGEYRSWRSMIARCENPDHVSYHRYGGRGIAVCDEWHDAEGFLLFAEHIGPRPSGTTLDRIKNDVGYQPGNVRWTVAKVQSNNREVSRIISFRGEAMNARDWAARLGMGKNTIDARLRKGWSVERALTEPAHMSGGRVSKLAKDVSHA